MLIVSMTILGYRHKVSGETRTFTQSTFDIRCHLSITMYIAHRDHARAFQLPGPPAPAPVPPVLNIAAQAAQGGGGGGDGGAVLPQGLLPPIPNNQPAT